jgi:hypothetical protein
MGRLALALAFGALIASALPAPGLYVALGLGIAAIGLGWAGYRRRSDPGFTRLAGAAAITLGGLGVVLGLVRVLLALAAIDHIDHMLG